MSATAALDTLLKRHRKAGSNGVHDAVSLLQEQMKATSPKTETAELPSPALRCLRPALLAAGWTGHERHIQEALPHFDTVADIDGLRAVLARLNFETPLQRTTLAKLTDNHCPCLFTTDGHDVQVILSRESGGLLVFDGTTEQTVLIPADGTSGRAYRPHGAGHGGCRAPHQQIRLDQLCPSSLQVIDLQCLCHQLPGQSDSLGAAALRHACL